MATVFLDPGLLTRRVTIERQTDVPDAFAGASQVFGVVSEVWARVEPIDAEVRERFGQRIGRATHRVTMRFRAGMERGLHLRLGGRRLRVLTVQDPDETGRWLVCRCEEET